MKKAILILTTAVCAFTAVSRAEEIQYAPSNPALLYWQAAALMPSLTDEEANDLRDLASGQLAFDAAKARNLHIDDGCLHLLRQAATSPVPCDWGLPYEDGPLTAMPHIAKIRQLAAVAIVQAETQFAAGKENEGIEWLLTAHRIARHAGAGDFLIGNLVQNLLETNALRAAARHCLAWDESARQSYASALKALPPLHTVREAMRGEAVLINWIERRAALGAAALHELEPFLRELHAGKPEDLAAVTAQMEPEALQATLTEWRALQGRMEAVVDKPWTQSQPELKALTEEAQHSSHLLIRDCIPNVTIVAEKWFALATLRTMLEAALALGPQLDTATIGGYRDALEGEPLRLQKGKDGTVILSAAKQHPAGKDYPAGKSLSLQLGK